MRTGIVIVGVVLVIVGAALSFVPLVPQPSQNLSNGTVYEANVTAFSITGSVPATVSWSSSQSGQLDVVTCSHVSSTNGCSGTLSFTNETGTGGTISVNIPDGGAIAIAFLGSGTATFHLTLAESTIGLILLVIGIVVLLVGLVLKGKQPKSAPTVPAPPIAEPTSPAAP